jgi:hypothetical protein
LYQPVLLPSHPPYQILATSTQYNQQKITSYPDYEDSNLMNGSIQLPRISNVIINVQRKTKGDYIKLSKFNRNINELEGTGAVTQYSEAFSSSTAGGVGSPP